MFKSEQIDQIAAALASAQSEMDFARKDSANPFFKSSYADLASVWDVCRRVLPKNGLAVSQTLEPSEGQTISVRTTLLHKSGQWITGVCQIPMVKADPQAAGSAITYARRYSLAAICGVIADDDDAEQAMGRKPAAKAAPRKKMETMDEIPDHSKKPVDVAALAEHIKTIKTVDELKKLYNSERERFENDAASVEILGLFEARKKWLS